MKKKTIAVIGVFAILPPLVFLTLRNDHWDDLFKTDKFISCNEFAVYLNALIAKGKTINNDRELTQKLLPAIKNGSIFKRLDFLTEEEKIFVFWGFIGNYFNEMAKRTALDSDEYIDGKSEKMRVVQGFILKNNAFFSGQYSHFNLGMYSSESNTILFEKRLQLPPLLWVLIFSHEARHAFDDIVTYKNQPPKGSILEPKVVEFETLGHASALCVWIMTKNRFLDDWEKKKLFFRHSHLTEYIIIEGTIDSLSSEENAFLEYLQNNRQPLYSHIQSQYQ